MTSTIPAKFKVNNKAYATCLQHIRSKLSDSNLCTLRAEYKLIDLLFRLADFPIQSPTLMWLARRGEAVDLYGPSRRTIRFTMGGQYYHFGHAEFALVTGLSFGELPQVEDFPETTFEKVFANRKSLTFGSVTDKLNDSVDPDGAVTRKLAVLYIIYNMVFVKDPQNKVSLKCVRLADDPARFNSFHWGTLIYDEIVREWAHAFYRLETMKTGKVQLKFATFPFAVQAWALETLGTEYAPVLAKQYDSNLLPRLLRWRTYGKQVYPDARKRIYSQAYLNLTRMCAEPDEVQQEYYISAVNWAGSPLVVELLTEPPPVFDDIDSVLDHDIGPALALGPAPARAPAPAQALGDSPAPAPAHAATNASAASPDVSVVRALKRLEIRMDRMEQGLSKKLSGLEEKVDVIAERVEVLDKRLSEDRRKYENRVVARLRNMADYQFKVANHRLNKELRADLGLHPPKEMSPENVHTLDDSGKIVKEASSPRADSPVHDASQLSEDAVIGAQTLEEIKAAFAQPQEETVIGDEGNHVHEKKARYSRRQKRPGPAAHTPYTNPLKKSKKTVVDDAAAVPVPLPAPSIPSADYAHDTSRDEVLAAWLKKKDKQIKKCGIKSIITCLEVIPAWNLLNLRTNGWLYNEDTDAIMQLLNKQCEAYSGAYPSTNWTCLGSLYSKSVERAETLLIEARTAGIGDGESGQVPWQDMDSSIFETVLGINANWESKSWMVCDYVYGIEHISDCHWAAYKYDFTNKTIEVYDSLNNHYTDSRSQIFKRHAAIVPSLYNCNFAHPKYKVDEPFEVKIVDVPQQKNGYDCGVYACKFIQCMTMAEDVFNLRAEHFEGYRKKLSLDIIQWYVSRDKLFFKEEQCIRD